MLFRRLQPAQRDEELVGFGQRFLFELIAVEEAVLLAVEAVQFTAIAQRLHLRGEGFGGGERYGGVLATVEDDRGWAVLRVT